MWDMIQNINMPQAKPLWKIFPVNLSVRQIHHSHAVQNRLYSGDREPHSLMAQIIWEVPRYLIKEWLIRYEDKVGGKGKPSSVLKIQLFKRMHELHLETWS